MQEKLMTIEEALTHFKVKNREAIYNRVRRGTLEKVLKNGITHYKIVPKDKTNTITKSNKQANTEIEDLKIKLARIEEELRGKDELLKLTNQMLEDTKKSKDDIIRSKDNEVQALQLSCNLLERENQRLLKLLPQTSQDINIFKEQKDNKPQTPKTEKAQEQEPQQSEPQELKIDLADKLLADGLNETERKRVKARFNKRVGIRNITKEQGKIYISKTENYEDLLKI